MAISQPYASILNTTLPSTDEVTSSVYTPHPGASGAALYFLSTEAGSLSVEIQLSNNAWALAQAAIAVVANDLVIVVFDQNRPRAIRVRFTPSAAPAIVVADVCSTTVSQPV